MQSKQSGFTFLELILVVAIIAIMAVVAIPKYINTKTSANNATLNAMGTALRSGANMVYAKAVIQGVQGLQTATIYINGTDTVEIRYGYPSASRNNGLSKLMGGNFSRDWTWSTSFGDRTFWLTTATLGGRSGVYINNTAVLGV